MRIYDKQKLYIYIYIYIHINATAGAGDSELCLFGPGLAKHRAGVGLAA